MRQTSISCFRPSLAVSICLLALTVRQAEAARIEVAEELLVDLRSEDLAPGPVTHWPNRGSLGGVFKGFGSPTVETVGGWPNVVRLDGQSYFEGPFSPYGIVGDGTRSIEVWVYNIGESKEECMVAWGHRGGPNGTNMAFNYGWKDFGAAGHWGSDADMAWQGFSSASGHRYPPLETWWYLVYTYDGALARLYVNGELNNEKVVVLNTHPADVIRIGCQNNSDGSAALGDMAFTGAIAQVRIHDGVLTPKQIQYNAHIRVQVPRYAANPLPEHGSPDVQIRGLVLSWTPGVYAGKHMVYLSRDMAAVEGGTATASVMDVNWYDPGALEFGQTYYWRVDEVNVSPDKTVFQGPVWSFTVEPFSRPLPSKSIKATASSSFSVDSGPEKTIDGSGLNSLGQHDTKNANMWTSSQGQDPPVWIQYEFDTVYKLHQMWVWNSNMQLESLAGLGVRTATVEYSTDAMVWTRLPEVPEFAQATGRQDYTHNTTVDFGGALARFVRITCTRSWSGRNQCGLSEVRFFYIPMRASDPAPADGADGVPLDTRLTWRAGREAASHQVYLGTSAELLTLLGTTQASSYLPTGLWLDTKYYWRIDEVNPTGLRSTWTGRVWSFSTQSYLVVDDFEDYGNASPSRVFQTWIDGLGFSADQYFPSGHSGNGTGAVVGHDPSSGPIMERTIVYGGNQSLPMRYNGLSEATRTFEVPQDWTIGGIRVLVLYFRGATDNVPGELYVKINDTKVSYTGDPADLAAGKWRQWSIDLPAEAGLREVKTLTIGVSDGKGILYFDDIRLYRAAPKSGP